jgi:hypothetical protein
MAVAPSREDTWLITCTVDELDLGVFDTFSGGEVDSEEAKYRPGGMAAEISLGGSRTIGNVTIGRYYDRLRDHPRLKSLASRVGAGRVTIGLTPLDASGLRGGDPLTYSGILKTITLPDIDSTGTDAAIVELECTIDGDIG